MIIIQAGLRLRVAELLALRLEDVDFLRRTVRVEWQLTQDGKHRVSPKTPRSRRTVPFPTVVAETLAARISECTGQDGSCSPRQANLYRQDTSVLISQQPRVQACRLASPRTTWRHHTPRSCWPLASPSPPSPSG